jgi:hypothetical protein
VSTRQISHIVKEEFENLRTSSSAKRDKTDIFTNHMFRKDLQRLIWQYNSKNEVFTLDDLLAHVKLLLQDKITIRNLEMYYSYLAQINEII